MMPERRPRPRRVKNVTLRNLLDRHVSDAGGRFRRERQGSAGAEILLAEENEIRQGRRRPHQRGIRGPR